jgi:hypothetical protein
MQYSAAPNGVHRARFHADQARWQRRDYFQELASRHSGPDQRRLAGDVDTVQREDVLCQINAKRCDVHVDFPFLVW